MRFPDVNILIAANLVSTEVPYYLMLCSCPSQLIILVLSSSELFPTLSRIFTFPVSSLFNRNNPHHDARPLAALPQASHPPFQWLFLQIKKTPSRQITTGTNPNQQWSALQRGGGRVSVSLDEVDTPKRVLFLVYLAGLNFQGGKLLPCLWSYRRSSG